MSGCAAWTRAAGRCRLAATWLLQANLYGLSPADPVTFAAIAAFLTVVGAAASYLPARRAMRVDPLDALRPMPNDSWWTSALPNQCNGVI